MLPLLHHHFTGYYTCSAPILPDIALAADQFLPDVAFAAQPFYWILHLQCTDLTRYCTCSRSILLDVAFAAPPLY